MPDTRDPAPPPPNPGPLNPGPPGPAGGDAGPPAPPFRIPRGAWVLAGFALLFPVIVWQVSQVRLSNDVESWLPDHDPSALRYAWYSAHFPEADSVLVSWDDATPDDPRLALFADALRGREDAEGVPRGGSRLFDAVLTPADLAARIAERGVEPAEAVQRLAGLLVSRGPLWVELTDAGRGDPAAAEERIAAAVRVAAGVEPTLTGPIEPPELLAGSADGDPGDRYAGDRYAAGGAADGDPEPEPFVFPPRPAHDLTVRWRGMYADADTRAAGRNAVLGVTDGAGRPLVAAARYAPGGGATAAVTLSEAGGADRRAAIAALVAAADDAGVPRESLHLGGRSVAGSELNDALKRAAWNRDAPVWRFWERSPLLSSFLVSVGLAFWLLGGVRTTLAVLAATAYAVLATVALVPLTGGDMNMVLVVMPTLLMVLGMSAAVHLVNYYRKALAEGPADTATARAVRTAWSPTALAAGTTAVGMASLAVSPLAPVGDFGVYSAVGCGVLLAVVMLGLPGLLDLIRDPGRVGAGGGSPEAWRNLGRWLAERHRPITVAAAVVFLVSVAGLRWFRTETKVIRYFPPTAKVVRDYDWIEDRVSGIVPVACVVRFDAETTDRMPFSERAEVVREITAAMRANPEVSGALSLADFLPENPPPPEDAGTLAKIRYNRTAYETERRVRGSAVADSLLTTARAVPGAAAAGVDADFAEPGDELWRITAQANLMGEANFIALTDDLDEAAGSVLRFHPGARHVVTGLVPLFLRTQQAVLEGLIESFGLAFLLIALAMSVLLRGPAAGLLAMAPNVMPVGVVFGLVSWARVPVDIGTMMSASVALGIAVDGTLHLVALFRHAPPELDQNGATAWALSRCGPALWQTSLIVGCGLMMLAPAELLMTSRFGWLMACLVFAALVADVILLPAMLGGLLGRLIREPRRRRGAGGAEPREELPPAEPAVRAPHVAVHRTRVAPD